MRRIQVSTPIKRAKVLIRIRLLVKSNSQCSSFPGKKKPVPLTSFSEYDRAVANRKHIPLAQFLANNQLGIHGVFRIQNDLIKHILKI